MADEEPISVKGATILGLLKYVSEKLGPEGRAELLKSLDKKDRAVFFESTDSSEPKTISLAEWYPYRTYINFLKAVIRKVGKGDINLCKDIGYWSADRDLNPEKGLYSFYASDAFKGDLSLIYRTSIPVIWGQMYNKGKIEIEEVEKGRKATFKVRDFPEVTEESCLIIGAWTERGSRLVSGSEVKVGVKYKPAPGIDCEFQLEW
ncbi:MAG: hypothetical protein JSU92_09675 [Deltaproteobacteria bacterium]|nr:MAG: hypothetical protein JSU92_09675 [Deltaproteobacteria bacterium]